MSNPNTQLAAAPKASPLALMASRFNSDPIKLLNTLKATVFASARNDEELMALVIVANQYGLNPLTKEIYAFPAKGGGIVPIVSIDGWANIANSHPQMDGVSFEWEHAGDKLISCTAVIHRKDRAHPVKITEYLSECKRATDPWKMEHRMLRHKAFCQGVRIAFGFSGIMDEDEAERITERDVTPSATNSPLFKAPEPQPALLEVESKPLLQQVKEWLAAEGVEWRSVAKVMLDHEEFGGTRDELDNCTDDELKRIVAMRAQLLAMVKGGAK